MSFKSLACVAALAAMTAASVHAQPTIGAVDNGDGTATIQVTPDAGFLPAAMAVELAITLSGGATLETGTVVADGSSGDVTISTPLTFDTPNPGDSPFISGSPIGGDATGITSPSATEIFVSFGSDVIGAAGAIDLVDIDFSGSGMLTIASDSLPFAGGDVVAQGGGFDAVENVDPLSIVLTAPGGFLLGDADQDGDVDGDDLIAVQTQFGNIGAMPLLGDADNDGDVDGDDLIAVQTEFGNTLSVAVPEPGSVALLVSLAGCAAAFARRR